MATLGSVWCTVPTYTFICVVLRVVATVGHFYFVLVCLCGIVCVSGSAAGAGKVGAKPSPRSTSTGPQQVRALAICLTDQCVLTSVYCPVLAVRLVCAATVLPSCGMPCARLDLIALLCHPRVCVCVRVCACVCVCVRVC